METRTQKGRLGSQRLLQIAVGKYPDLLDDALRAAGSIGSAETVTWTSPLEAEGFKEFRDLAALEKLGISDSINYPLKGFWPRRGPVWDATGITSQGAPLLLEAKAHIPEAASPASGASPESMQLIEKSLERARKFYSPRMVWYFPSICQPTGSSILFEGTESNSQHSGIFGFYQCRGNGWPSLGVGMERSNQAVTRRTGTFCQLGGVLLLV